MMAGAAHDPSFSKRVKVPQKVAKEFNKEDKLSGFLSAAMRGRNKKSTGGKVK
jgi:hypothetical protein